MKNEVTESAHKKNSTYLLSLGLLSFKKNTKNNYFIGLFSISSFYKESE